ncbi:MAG: hypothetical protein ACUVQD_01820 [Thermaceae bacterium]
MLTWIDLLALFALSIGIALGIRLGAGFGLGAFFGGLLYLPAPSPWAGLLLGFLLGSVLKSLWPLFPTYPKALDRAVGGVGGGVLGFMLALALWVSLPAEWTPSTGALRYPSTRLSTPLYEAVRESPFASSFFTWVQQVPVLGRIYINLR